MAYRKTVFSDHCFDERLQRFGGYALWEDALFSHRLHREGYVLYVTAGGLVTHRPAPGGRMENPENKGRVTGYNACLVWWNAVFPFNRWSIPFFLWARLGFLCALLAGCISKPWRKIRWKQTGGYIAGLWTFFRDEVRSGLAGRQTAELRLLSTAAKLKKGRG